MTTDNPEQPTRILIIDDDEPVDTQDGDGSKGATPLSVTQRFCRPDRTTPLSRTEGTALWKSVRQNGYAPCSIRVGVKRPFGDDWQIKAFGEATAWREDAPGIGLTCGGLDMNGEPAPVASRLIVLDFDFRLTKANADYDRRASEASSEGRPEAPRLRKIADHLQAIESTLVEKEQSLSRMVRDLPTLATLRASALERGRANNPNFALLFRNGEALGNAAPKLHYPVQVDGEIELIDAFGIDRLASGKQLVGYHLHPDTGHPWLWKDNRSPENMPLGELPQIDTGQWDALWREIVGAGATLGLVEKGARATNPSSGDRAGGSAAGARAGVDMKAIVELLTPHWPTTGSRHEVALALGGLFCRAGFSEIEIGDVVEQAARAAGDEEIEDRVKAAKSAVSAQAEGKKIAGKPRIAELLGDEVAERLCEFAIYRTEPGYVSYYPFTMDASDGLTKKIYVGSGKSRRLETISISGAFEVLGRCRDPNGTAWGKLIRYRDADNRTHDKHISDAALHGEPGALCGALADAGLRIDCARQRELAGYLCGVDVAARVTVVGRTGWHEIGRPVFVMPGEAISAPVGESIVLDPTVTAPYETAGTLAQWQEGVGKLTAGHVLAVFAVSAAFAGPLAYLVGAEGGGINLFAQTSVGKTTLLQAHASAWGRGGTPGYVRSWRATANGLEGAAASATDTCLVIDELGVGEAREVWTSIYMLANGVGKSRARQDGSSREPKSWRSIYLSSGEIPVEAKLVEDHGRKARGGQTVRILDIAADRGLGFGAFDHAGGFDNAGQLADAIKEAAVTNFGTAGPEFVRRLIAHGVEKVADIGRKFIGQFVDQVVEPGASEQVHRVAKRFALIALAGELATVLGITPWQRGEARAAAVWAFTRWVEKRGGTGSHEDREAVRQIRLMIEQHGESRFERVEDYVDSGTGIGVNLIVEEGRVRDRLGWRKGDGVSREYWIPPEVWKAEFCAGLDPTFVARVLAQNKMLRRQDKKHLQCTVSLGKRTIRAYVLTAAILDS